MNKEWSDLNKAMQTQLKKEATYQEGIQTALLLRKDLMEQILNFKEILSKEEFCAIPYINANGFHSKTIAYSLFHIFRIEDIVANSLIRKEKQIFFANDYQSRMNATIITTGNELVKQEIATFSEKLDLDELYQYIQEVDQSTTILLKQLTYQDLKIKMTEEDKDMLHKLKTVSEDENAVFLIDYWCGKTIKGLIQMPFTRHWIMHIEACIRIMDRVHK